MDFFLYSGYPPRSCSSLLVLCPPKSWGGTPVPLVLAEPGLALDSAGSSPRRQSPLSRPELVWGRPCFTDARGQARSRTFWPAAPAPGAPGTPPHTKCPCPRLPGSESRGLITASLTPPGVSGQTDLRL